MSDELAEMVTNCAIIKGNAITLGQYLRGDYDEPPELFERPTLDELKEMSQEMLSLSEAVKNYVTAIESHRTYP